MLCLSFIYLVLRISFIRTVFLLNFIFFFHLGLFYWSGSQIPWLSWSGPVCIYQNELLGRFFLQPPKFPGMEVNIYDFFATFCFIVVFGSLHQRQLHWRQFTFLKGEWLLLSFISFYFIIISILIFTIQKIIQKLCKNCSTND